MLERYRNYPIIGVTHFFAEDIATEEGRKQRENELICEFSPTTNKTSGTGRSGPSKGHLECNTRVNMAHGTRASETKSFGPANGKGDSVKSRPITKSELCQTTDCNLPTI